MSTAHSIMLIAVCAAVTFSTRALPFVLFGAKRQMPESVSKILGALPPAIIAVLVIYCIKGDVTAPGAGTIASLLGIACAAVLQLWKKNILLSISCSTVLYMVLIRIFGVI